MYPDLEISPEPLHARISVLSTCGLIDLCLVFLMNDYFDISEIAASFPVNIFASAWVVLTNSGVCSYFLAFVLAFLIWDDDLLWNDQLLNAILSDD